MVVSKIIIWEYRAIRHASGNDVAVNTHIFEEIIVTVEMVFIADGGE